MGLCFLWSKQWFADWFYPVNGRPCVLCFLRVVMDPSLTEQLVLSVLLMIFCPFPEPWRTWKIIPLSSPPWDPSTTSFHSVWRGCLGWPHQDHLKAPYSCSTSRGCRWGVFILVIPAVSLQCGCVYFWFQELGVSFRSVCSVWNWHSGTDIDINSVKEACCNNSRISSRIYIYIYIFFLQCLTDLFLAFKSLRKVLWIYSLLVMSV